MKVIIAGSRSGVGELDIANVLDRVAYFEYPFPITEVVCGEAKGADFHGRRWAEHCRIPVASFPADWEGGVGPLATLGTGGWLSMQMH